MSEELLHLNWLLIIIIMVASERGRILQQNVNMWLRLKRLSETGYYEEE